MSCKIKLTTVSRLPTLGRVHESKKQAIVMEGYELLIRLGHVEAREAGKIYRSLW